jgi:hypothetical protein
MSRDKGIPGFRSEIEAGLLGKNSKISRSLIGNSRELGDCMPRRQGNIVGHIRTELGVCAGTEGGILSLMSVVRVRSPAAASGKIDRLRKSRTAACGFMRLFGHCAKLRPFLRWPWFLSIKVPFNAS